MAVSRSVSTMLVTSFLVAATSASVAQTASTRLDYQVQEGLNLNRFVREGNVAAHLVLRSGNDPRILIAFPAGNSGVGVWFESLSHAARWRLPGPLRTIRTVDGRGRALYGVCAEASIDAAELQVRQAVLSSVRELRDYQSLGTVLDAIKTDPTMQVRTLTWARDRFDGAAGYRLMIEVTHGALRGNHIHAGANGIIGLRITGLSGETPLTPLSGHELLDNVVTSDVGARNALTFLSYREKLLAGSWRFDTYFGRDTLMGVRLLMPVLSAMAVEAGLSSVLARLSVQGEVAHEEDIGERAVLDHWQSDGTRSATPVLDYKMIDGDYLLAPVADAWLLHDERGRARAAAFLARPVESIYGRAGTRGEALLDNLRLVLNSAAAFAAQPTPANLIGLKKNYTVGEWRDSDNGLGGGRYPFDVNAVLVPAALEAAAQLHDSGLLAPYEDASDAALFARASQMASTWRTKAPALFAVTVGREAAARAVEAYASTLDIPAQPAIAALDSGDVHFHALALDASGMPIPVMHSDEGFALLFGQPDAAQMDRDITALMRPFPSGLMMDAGMVVANPVFCPPPLQARFSRNAYHGTVVWSWQQAMFAAGLARQLQRGDLPASVRSHLLAAQHLLWAAIDATASMKSSELWSWAFVGGHFEAKPFGANAADADESNAAQLWSTVYLAVQPPRGLQ